MTPLLRKLLGLNWVLVIVMYLIAGFGVLAIESAARHFVIGGEYYATRQTYWIFAGTLVYFTTALLDYRWVKYLGPPLYLVGLGFMLYALKVDDEVHRVVVAGISFQPSQLMIAAGIILIGVLLQELPRLYWLFGLPIARLAIVGIVTGIPFSLVVLAGDMGSAIVWLPVAGVALLVGGLPFRYIIFMALLGVGLVPIAHKVVLPQVSERGAGRIEVFLDMREGKAVDIKGDAYAPHWVSTAVGKAGWKGVGWKASAEKGSLHDQKFIPWKTAHNDFIFAVFAEERGFGGSMLLITAFGLLLIQCLFIAFYSRDMSGRIIASGVVALFFAHIFENVGMCVLLMPITGIPLPLFSYSGTFMLMCLFLLGLVQSVWVHRNVEIEED